MQANVGGVPPFPGLDRRPCLGNGSVERGAGGWVLLSRVFG
jgi:hypothetical protein